MTAPHRTHGRKATELRKSCLNKRRFPNELTARAAAQIECDRGAAINDAMWVYSCETCRGWHLTNKKKGPKNRVTSEHLFAPTLDDIFQALADER